MNREKALFTFRTLHKPTAYIKALEKHGQDRTKMLRSSFTHFLPSGWGGAGRYLPSSVSAPFTDAVDTNAIIQHEKGCPLGQPFVRLAMRLTYLPSAMRL